MAPFDRALVLLTLSLWIGAPARGGDCGAFCAEIKQCTARLKKEHLGELLCRTARCETGNKCVEQIDSPNGLYAGPFQFASGTWKGRCRPFFRRKHLTECLDKEDVYDTCCSALCAADMVSRGGLKHWRVCGPKAQAQMSGK